jgi:hypothetical protein
MTCLLSTSRIFRCRPGESTETEGLISAGRRSSRSPAADDLGFFSHVEEQEDRAAPKPKPVNNTRADKLDSFMWRYSFAKRRCLMPVTQFAEAEETRETRSEPGSRYQTSPCSQWQGSGPTFQAIVQRIQSAAGDAQPAELVRRPISAHEPLRTNMALCGAA